MNRKKSSTALPMRPKSTVKASKAVRTRQIMFKFRLYVANGTQNSAQAGANLRALCRIHLPERHTIEMLDVFREPKRALADAIFMTPTLVKIAPSPTCRIVGTLSQTDTVLQTMGVKEVT